MRTKPFNYMQAYSYRTRLLEDYFDNHGWNFDNAIRDYRRNHPCSHFARRMEIIEALYWLHAFGLETRGHKHTCITCGAVMEVGDYDCEMDHDHDFAQCRVCEKY